MTCLSWLSLSWRHGELQLVLQFRAPQAWWWWGHSTAANSTFCEKWTAPLKCFLIFVVGSPAGLTYLWREKNFTWNYCDSCVANSSSEQTNKFNGSTSRLFHAVWRCVRRLSVPSNKQTLCFTVNKKNAKPKKSGLETCKWHVKGPAPTFHNASMAGSEACDGNTCGHDYHTCACAVSSVHASHRLLCFFPAFISVLTKRRK